MIRTERWRPWAAPETLDDAVPAAEAARTLGLSFQRVRVLVSAGEMPGRKVAGRWFVDRSAVERRGRNPKLSGRPNSSAHVWGLIALADGESTPWLATIRPISPASPSPRTQPGGSASVAGSSRSSRRTSGASVRPASDRAGARPRSERRERCGGTGSRSLGQGCWKPMCAAGPLNG